VAVVAYMSFVGIVALALAVLWQQLMNAVAWNCIYYSSQS